MLEIIIGRAGSGKTAKIYEKISESAKNGRNSILIVPEQFSHEAERELCAVCGNGIGLHAEVLSFSRLCSRVMAESGGLSDRVLDAGGRILLMDLTLKTLAGKLSVYDLGRHRPDFLKRLLDTKDELQAARATSEDIAALSERTGGVLSRKLSDFAAIIDTFNALIPENVIDAFDRMDILAERVGESSIGGDIYIDGFTDFTAQEAEVVRELLKKCDSVTVCLNCDDVFGTETQFEIARITVSRLLAAANREGIEYKITKADDTEITNALTFLQRYLLSDEKPTCSFESTGVSLARADTISRECEKAASEAKRLVRETGCRWRDITVAATAWESYRAIAPGIFEKYGVPIYTYDKEDVLQKPVLSLVTGVLDIIGGGWEYGDVFRYLKTDMTGMSAEKRDILENYVYKWNIRGEKMWCREEAWFFPVNGYDGAESDKDKETLVRVNEMRKAVSAPIHALSERLKGTRGARNMVKALYAFTEDIGLFDRISEKTARLREAGDNQSAEEYAQLWGILVSAMEQFADVLGDTETDRDEFSRLFRLLLSQYEVGSIPASIDTVGIGDISRMRRRNVKHLILLGASDDMLPSFSEAGGAFTDLERDEIEERGIELSNTSHMRLARQMNAIYTAVNLPSETLLMTYSDRGGTARPSYIYAGVAEMLGIKPDYIKSDIREEATFPCFELAAMGDKTARAYFMAEEERKARLLAALTAAKTPRGSLSRTGAMRLYGRDIRLTASRVDKYKSCKFAYFMQYGLRAKARTKATFEAPEAGTFIHYILENVTKDIMEDGGFASISEDKIKILVEKHAEKFIEENLDGFRDKSKRFIYLFNRLIADAVSIVTQMAQELSVSDFVPLDFELDFSNGGAIPPAEIADETGSLTVSGKVDRVDGWVHGDRLYLRVVDYKTGRKEFSLSDVLSGIGLQMLIYLFVLQKKGVIRYDKEIVPAGVLYMPARDVTLPMGRGSTDAEIEKERLKNLRRHGLLLSDKEMLEAMEHGDTPKYIPVKFSKDGEPTGDSIADVEHFGLLSRHIDELLSEMCKGLRSGAISADPYFRNSIDNACSYCDFFEACHFGDDKSDKQRYLSKLKAPQVWEYLKKEADDGREG